MATGVGLVSDQWLVPQQQEEGLGRVRGTGNAADTFRWGVQKGDNVMWWVAGVLTTPPLRTVLGTAGGDRGLLYT